MHFSNVHFVLCQNFGLNRLTPPFHAFLPPPLLSIASTVRELKWAIMSPKKGQAMQRYYEEQSARSKGARLSPLDQNEILWAPTTTATTLKNRNVAPQPGPKGVHLFTHSLLRVATFRVLQGTPPKRPQTSLGPPRARNYQIWLDTLEHKFLLLLGIFLGGGVNRRGRIPHPSERCNVFQQWRRDTRTVKRMRHHLLC